MAARTPAQQAADERQRQRFTDPAHRAAMAARVRAGQAAARARRFAKRLGRPPGAFVGYATVYGPPDDWGDLKVYREDTGAEIAGVIEVDAVEGWLRRGRPEERLTGRFVILRPVVAPEAGPWPAADPEAAA